MYLKLDDLHLRQILINLVGNAIKFTEQGSVTLIVRTENSGDKKVNLSFTVKDTGCGIAEDKFEKIFRSFEQGDEMVPGTYGGTGLGLSISQRLVELMEGKITVQSKLGEGSSFTVSIENVCIEVSDNSLPEKVKTDLLFESMKILIVDDTKNNREILKEYLCNQPVSIEEAENGQEAFEKLKDFHPDVILLDMKMPVMDGYEFSRKVRDHDSYKHLKIIAITASALKSDQEVISEICDGYLAKPILQKNLFASLKTLGFKYREIDSELPAIKPIDLSETQILEFKAKLGDKDYTELFEKALSSLSINDLYQLVKALELLHNDYNDVEFSNWLKEFKTAIDMFDMNKAEEALLKAKTLKVFSK